MDWRCFFKVTRPQECGRLLAVALWVASCCALIGLSCCRFIFGRKKSVPGEGNTFYIFIFCGLFSGDEREVVTQFVAFVGGLFEPDAHVLHLRVVDVGVAVAVEIGGAHCGDHVSVFFGSYL